jgi:uncharacterized protein (TIGR02117 family)
MWRDGRDVLAGESGGGDAGVGITVHRTTLVCRAGHHPGMDRRRFLATRFALRLAAMLALSLAHIACSAPLRETYPPARGEPLTSVSVVSHGWHTGIAVRPADIPDGVWPEHRQLGAAEQLEVAWGDRDFYMAPRGTLRLALRAAFWSSASVLHISAFDRRIDQVFPGQEIVQVRLSQQGLRRLAGFFQDAYARDPAGEIIVLGRGQYASSRFYAAREKYFLLRTCNTWTARALREAGLPIEPLQIVTAAGLMDEVRKLVQLEPR